MKALSKDLVNILQSAEPTSLLSITALSETEATSFETVHSHAADWTAKHPNCAWQQLYLANGAYSFSSRVDLVLISHTLELLEIEEAKLLLGQIRNFGAKHIAVVVEAQSRWTFNDFISFGFRRQENAQSQAEQNPQFQLYTYNLDTYNHKRSWNNSRFWANPEMWNKSRW